MSRAVVFKSASGINCDMGVKPSPVRSLEPHVDFYTGMLGFTPNWGVRAAARTPQLGGLGIACEPSALP